METFTPELDVPDSQPIIVDALLTNQDTRHSVTINRANSLDESNQFAPITNGNVFVEDSNGQIFDFKHSANGKYTSVNSFAGIVGNAYRLVIEIDGQQYESTFEELRPEVEISKINASSALQSMKSETGEVSNELRVRVSVNLNFPADQEVYYRFDWNSTHIARTLNQGSAICWNERGISSPENLEVSSICFVSEESSSFLKLFTSKGLQGTSIDTVTIYSIDPSKRFQTKYSPEITLFNITETAYDFWKAVENQVSNTGSLFDSPPGSIDGNIRSTDSGDERVIGIFEVASVTKSRAFFLHSVVNRVLDNYTTDCGAGSSPPGSPPPVRPLFCCDCRLLPNSSHAKPDFWED